MFIIFSFFALIMVSLAARFFEGRLSKYNFVIFTLKYVPAVCAFMGAAFVFALILQRCVSGSVSKQAFIFIFFAQVLAIIAAGFCVFLHCARKMNFSFLKTCLSFLLGFVFSLVLTLVLFAANCFLYFNTFQYLKIHPDHTCQMRLKPLFSFCPEYDRQIVFKSGKIIGIHLDTCGLSDFKVYKLNNGNLYLECMQNFGNSYVIDEENEKTATVVVPDYQLSLAIGKEGQNVRLAARVSGWKIDIKSHSQYEAMTADEDTPKGWRIRRSK